MKELGHTTPIKIQLLLKLILTETLYWVGVGAQPTETVRAMLSYRGILYKNHLLKGVTKGALTDTQAEEKVQFLAF